MQKAAKEEAAAKKAAAKDAAAFQRELDKSGANAFKARLKEQTAAAMGGWAAQTEATKRLTEVNEAVLRRLEDPRRA